MGDNATLWTLEGMRRAVKENGSVVGVDGRTGNRRGGGLRESEAADGSSNILHLSSSQPDTKKRLPRLETQPSH